MAEVASVDYYCGEVATIIATNRPYTDMTVQSQVNDYRWADTANIKIYNEKNILVADAYMCPITDKVGWYYYRHKTTCDCGTGIHRVEITMTTAVDDCSSPATTGASGDPGTSGTSGDPGTSGTSGTSGDPGTSGTSGTSGDPGTSGTSGDPGTSGTSGTSGDPGGLVDCTNVAIYYFRVNPRR